MSFIFSRQLAGFLTIITMLVMVFGVFAMSAQAVSPPNMMTYQGRVLDANGVPISGSTLSMKFFLYTAATGGTCVWSNSSGTCHTNTPATTSARTVTLTSGLFTENLGDTAASTPYAAIADSTFADNVSIYLAVEIAGETLSPRKQLVAAPYALNAETLDGIDLATIQLWEVGTNGSYEDDSAAIVGADAAFSYGSGGVGDLRVADQLEVMDDGYIDNDLVVGASTSSTETISHTGFILNGNDLFVAGELGVEGHIYTDGSVFAVGLVSAAAFVCTDCIDFTEIDDDLGLDASTSIIQDGAETFTITNSGTGDTIIDLASTGDFIVSDNGSTFFTLSDAGAFTLTLDATDNPAFMLTDSGTSNVTFNLASTGDFVIQDNGTAAFTVNDSGNAVLAGDLAVNGDDITSDGALTITASTYTRIGDVSTPGDASTDDDLYVSGAFEVDGTAFFDGSVDFDGAVDMDSTLNVDGATTFTNTLSASAGQISLTPTQTIASSAGATWNGLTVPATTATITGATGITTATGFNLVNISQPTLSAASALTVANSASLYIANAPTGGGVGPAAITNAYSLWVDAGASRLDGALTAGATLAVTGDTTLTGDLAVNGDDITSDGALTITASTYTRIGDVSTPGDASTDDDLYVSGAFEVDGSSFFDGVVDLDVAGSATTTTTGILDMDVSAGNAAVDAVNLTLTQANGAAGATEATAIDILLDAEDADGNLIGVNITNQTGTTAGVAGSYEALLRLTNTEGVVGVVTDAIFINDTSSTGGAIVDAIDASDADIINALNVGSNAIVGTTGAITYTGATTWSSTGGDVTIQANGEGIDLVLSGGDTLQSIRAGGNDAEILAEDDILLTATDDTNILLLAAGNVVIDAATNDHTSLTGALDLNFESSTSTAQAANISVTAIDDDAADTIIGLYIDTIIQDDTTATDTVYGAYVNVTNSDTNAAGTGLLIEVDDDGVGVINSGVTISNQQSTDIDLTDGLLVLATTDGSLVDALDASDPEITNALNVGANLIVGTTGAITYTGATTWSSTGGDVTILANVEGADLLLGGGDTLQATLTGGNDVEIRAEDDFFVNVTDDTTFRLQAGGDIVVDATTNARTGTASGALDINLSTVGGSGAGTFVRGFSLDMTVTDNNAANNISGADITITSTSDDADTIYGLTITNINSGDVDQDITAGILLVNSDLTAGDDFSAGILFADLASGGFTYGIDLNGATIDTADIRLENGETIANGTNDIVDITGQLEITLDGTAVTDEALCAGTAAGGEGADGDAADQTDILVSDCSGSPTGDYAEQYPVASGISFGDIVVPGMKKVVTRDGQAIVQLVKSSAPYAGPVAGIVSNNYGDFTSAGYNIPQSDNPMPVALVGRVPVNVTNENGSIKIGDYLTTSSTPGHAMKATKVGRVIGMALADFDGSVGQVMVQVNNGWYLGEVITNDGSSTIVTDKAVMAPLRRATAEEPGVGSYGFALRGSAWDGAEAKAVEMLLKTTVTDTNNFRLSVRNTTDTEVAYITNTGTMQISGDMVITGKLYPSDRGVAQTNKYIYYDGSSGAGGDFMRTNAKGWSTGSYDFAEMFPSDDTLQAGEVVVFGDSGAKVARSMEANSARIAGIVSTRPGFLAGDNTVGSHPVALAGRVPTRVTSENGEVKVGDPLTTSSKPGYAMKATEPGMIVGYALEPVVSGDTSILVYVNVGYWGGEAISALPGTNNQASGFGSGTNVNYSALNMTGNIYVSGNEILSVGRIAGIGEVWSIDQDGTMKTEGLLKIVTRSYTDEKVETIAVTSPEAVMTLTGTAKLSGGQAEVRFEEFAPSFNDVTAADAPLRVIVTPSGPVSLYVSEKDNNHFVVKSFAGEPTDVEFDWMVTAYRKGYEPVSVIASPEQSPVIASPAEPDEAIPANAEIASSPEEPAPRNDNTVDPAPPVSPEQTIVDSLTEDEGGEIAEQPSESPIETTTSSVQEVVTE